jgi:hypothetical protein
MVIGSAWVRLVRDAAWWSRRENRLDRVAELDLAWCPPREGWSVRGQSSDRGVAGPGVAFVSAVSARSMWASAVPMARTRTGRKTAGRPALAEARARVTIRHARKPRAVGF